jgi:hypothetical protein
MVRMDTFSIDEVDDWNQQWLERHGIRSVDEMEDEDILDFYLEEVEAWGHEDSYEADSLEEARIHASMMSVRWGMPRDDYMVIYISRCFYDEDGSFNDNNQVEDYIIKRWR